MTSPGVVVLVATHNGMPYIREQFPTLLTQENVAVRLVVSDDSSSDGTQEWLRMASEQDSRIELLPSGTYGSAAKNFYQLIIDTQISGAGYVAFSDQDDLWKPDKLSRAVAQIQAHDADGYSSDVLAFYPDARTTPVVKSHRQQRWDYLFSSAGPGCTYVVRAAPFLALQSDLRENIDAATGVEYHDWLVYAWLRHHGYRWIIDPWVSMRYRQHERNVLGANSGWRAKHKRIMETLRGGPFDQVLSLAAVVGAQHEFPIRLLSSGERRDLIRLAFKSRHLRRSTSDAVALAALLMARAASRDLLLGGPSDNRAERRHS